MDKPMLFFDESGLPLAEQIKNAAERYEERYGRRPNVCHVNPITMDDRAVIPDIDLEPDSYVLPGRIMLGVRGASKTFEEK